METLDITLGDSPKDQIKVILGHIRPLWSPRQIIIKDVVGGHINRIYSCALNDDVEGEDVLAVRVFGQGRDSIKDREKEILAMRIGHHTNIALPIYCRFNNGVVYKYQRGGTLNFKNQTEEMIARGVAKELAKLHLTNYIKILKDIGEPDKIVKYQSCFSMSKYLPIIISDVPERYADLDKEKIRRNLLMTKAEVCSEVERLDSAMDAMQFPIVFCHNDLKTGNIVFDKVTGRVHFIDWELADIGHAINDISTFFLSHVYTYGVECSPDQLDLYPDKEYQMKWIRWYLEYKAELCGEDPNGVKTAHIENMYIGVNLSAMRTSLILSQVRLLQEVTSPKPIDYFAVAIHMQSLYSKIKCIADKNSQHPRPNQ